MGYRKCSTHARACFQTLAITITFKKDRQCKSGSQRLIPYQSEDRSPTIPTIKCTNKSGNHQVHGRSSSPEITRPSLEVCVHGKAGICVRETHNIWENHVSNVSYRGLTCAPRNWWTLKQRCQCVRLLNVSSNSANVSGYWTCPAIVPMCQAT